MKGKVVYVLFSGELSDYNGTDFSFKGVFERSDDAIAEVIKVDPNYNTYTVQLFKDQILYWEHSWSIAWIPWKIITTTIL